MAEILGSAVLEISTRDTGFSRGVDRAERAAQGLEQRFSQVTKSLDRLGSRLSDLGKRLTMFVSVPLAGLAASTVKAASSVQETSNLLRETFGQATDDVRAWAAATAEAVGRSRYALERAAGDFAAFLQPLGVAPQLVVPMSEALTQLMTDISSFRNIAEEDVFTSLFSGLAGETEAVRRLGIDIGEAALESELLALGLAKSSKEATEAQKVLARFSLMVKQTTAAQGDAIRTSGSFENQTRTLGAALRDLQVRVGEALIAPATEVVSSISSVVRGLSQLQDSTIRTILQIGGFTIVAPLALGALGLLVQGLGFVLSGIQVFVAGGTRLFSALSTGIVTALRVAMSALVRFVGFITSMPGLVVAGLVAVIGSVVFFRDTLVGLFSGLVIAIKNAFVAGFNNLVVRPFQEALNFLIGLVNSIPLLELDIEPVTVNDVVNTQFVDDVRAVFSEAKATAAREMDDLSRNVSAVFAGIADGAKSLVPESIRSAVDDISRVLDMDAGAGNASGATSVAQLMERIRELMGQTSAAAQQGAESVKKRKEAIDKMTASEAKARASVWLGERALKSSDAAAEKLDTTMASLGATFESSFEQAIIGGQSFSDTLKGLLDDITRVILRTQILGPMMNSLFGTGGVLTNVLGGVFGGSSYTPSPESVPMQSARNPNVLGDLFFDPSDLVMRAAGGPLRSGQPAIVGERGPELFVPRTAGTVIPNMRGVVVNVNNSGQPLQVESQTTRMGANGEQIVDITVRASLERMAGNGQLDNILAPFTARRQVAF